MEGNNMQPKPTFV